MSKKAWLVRPFPHGKKRLDEFMTKEIIALGWPGIGNLSQKSREDIKRILSDEPYHLQGLALGNAYATVDIFVNQMQVGDFILTPDGNDIYFGEIIGDYQLDLSVDTNNEGYSHQRKVKWLSNTSRSNLSVSLRTSLKAPRTIADLSKNKEEIEILAYGGSYEEAINHTTTNTISVTYPLRADYNISFELPSDITKDEAKRLSIYLKTLYFAQ